MLRKTKTLGTTGILLLAGAALFAGAAAAQEEGPNLEDTMNYIANLHFDSSALYPEALHAANGALCIARYDRNPSSSNEVYNDNQRTVSNKCAQVSDLAVNKVGLAADEITRTGEAVDDVIIGCATTKKCWHSVAFSFSINGQSVAGISPPDDDKAVIICHKTGNCYNAVIHLLRLMSVQETTPVDPFQ